MASKYFFKGFSKLFKGPQDGGRVATVGGVKPNVPKTKKEKMLRDLKILKQKTKASGARLKQTQFELKNKKPLTFKTKTGKSESNKEAYKRIQKENTKVLKGMIDDAFKNVKKEKKATGGRVGRMGGGMMGRRFGMKEGSGKNLKPVDPKKQKGLSKLPREVRNKMGYMKSGGRAGYKFGTTRPRPGENFDPNNPINKRKKEFKEEAKKDMK